jgi:hypothetical protein
VNAAKLTRKWARAFDKERRALLGADAVLMLLKPSTVTPPYEVVTTVTSGWRTDKGRQDDHLTVLVADGSAEFAAKVRESTDFIVVGSSKETLNNFRHTINNDTTISPDAEVYWQIGAKGTGKRYFLAT